MRRFSTLLPGVSRCRISTLARSRVAEGPTTRGIGTARAAEL